MKVKLPKEGTEEYKEHKEYTELLSVLSPATDILNTIQFDHLYSARNGVQSPSNGHPGQEIKDGTSAYNSPSCSWDTGVDSNGKVGQELSENIRNENISDVDPEMNSLDADSIQQVFQNAINMTSFAPISDAVVEEDACPKEPPKQPTTFESSSNRTFTQVKSNCLKIVNPLSNIRKRLENTNADDLKNDTIISFSEDHVKDTRSSANNLKSVAVVKRKIKSESKETERVGKSFEPKEVGEEEWKSKAKILDAERKYNVLMKYAADLMVRRWIEYICMTADEIRAFEMSNAREQGMTEEVIEMVKDKDGRVSELTDELQFDCP